MSPSVFIDFIIYACSVGWSPGPNNLLLLSLAGKNGFKKALPLLLGIWSGAVTVMIICGMFCKTLGDIIPWVRLPLKVICICYMLWIAYGTLRRKPAEASAVSDPPGFFSGFILQFVNAKIILLGISMITAYILPYTSSTLKVVCLSPLMVLGTASGNLIWLLFGSALNKFYSRFYRTANIIVALLLFWCIIKVIIG